MRRIAPIVSLAALLAVPLGARAQYPVTQPPCADGGDSVSAQEVWKQLGNDVLENLLFADGSLWISDGTASAVRRFGADGSEGTGSTGIPSPGGLAVGPDGLIYAGSGNSIGNAVSRNGAAKVVRFSPAQPQARADYATGFSMANGMTFGPGNDLYISNDFDRALLRIPWTPSDADLPVGGGAGGWHVLSDVYGTNGLVVDPSGATLYAAITFDQRSPIERVDLASLVPGSPLPHATHAQLSVGVLSLEPGVHTTPNAAAPVVGVKGLDDMTRDATGTLYVVGNGTGELLRVDTTLPGHGCLIASGLRNPSSVRIAPPGSGFEMPGWATTFYVTEFSGRIVRVGYTPG